MRAKIKQKYHCDMFYFDNVCPSRGEEDPADIRYREGWILDSRSTCKTLGICPLLNDTLCPHCVEFKKYFRAEPRVLTGQVVNLTPFQAKDTKAKTIKAYSKSKPLYSYLNRHPYLYGVNVNEGKILREEKQVEA